jgi:diacylglycerol kinase family enzyme/membrane-associated phospholipid phosphatase
MPTVSDDDRVPVPPDRAPARGASRRATHRATPGVNTGVNEVRAAVAAVAGLAGFVAVLLLVASDWPPLTDFDQDVAATMAATFPATSTWADVLVVVDDLTKPWVLRGLTLIIAALLIRHGRRRLGLWLIGTMAIAGVLEGVLKLGIGRARPDEALIHAHGFSMPSGHALNSAAFVGALLILLPLLGASRRAHGAAWVAGTAVVVLVGFDRVGLAVHYVSDVVAAWFLAMGALGCTVLGFGIGRRRIRTRVLRRERGRRRVAVVYNPAKIDNEVAFRELLDGHAVQAGWNAPTWYETTVDDPGHAMAREALERGTDLVIAAGGDGTVRVVCSELAGTGVPVGIVPAGTGNLLVRNIGLPLDRTAAIRVAFGGQNRVIDLVRVEGDGLTSDRFAVMAGLGLDAVIVGDAPGKLKARMGWWAYALSMARNLSFPSVRVDISLDDRPAIRRWVRSVVVGNVGTLQAGLSLLPNARPDDGLLDVVAIAPRRLIDWPGLAWRVARRSPAQDDRLRRWRGRRVVIRAVEACPRQLDGDVVGVGHELRCEVEPGVLVVRVPGSDASR